MIIRRVIVARGAVQGVGFRPFVYRQACARGLGGSVRNAADGVRIEVEGEAARVDDFVRSLRVEAPPLAQLERLDEFDLAPSGACGFSVEASIADGERVTWPAVDTAPCEACRRELDDAADRRYRYPFINCTACGPRLSIMRALPYDRERTTMVPFRLCEACRREYHDPQSRRFHAEPNACPRCGPTLTFESGAERLRDDAALSATVAALRRGAIVAIKGAGGFHLACDAASSDAVARLRRRKRRPAKPLALLAADLGTVQAHALVSAAERTSLASPACPIVLLRRREGSRLAPEVAPGMREIGFMLPPTPLHLRVAEAFAAPLVMTSGNLAGEPLAREDDEARRRLAGTADAFLLHDRAITTRVDDSVLRVEGSVERLLRRARGYVPAPVHLSTPSSRRVLATGADLKNTFCVAANGMAFVSQHLGALGNPDARAAWKETLSFYQELFRFTPEVVACDTHPDYASTRLAEAFGLPLVRVAHHHAHVAACLAEHGHVDPVVGVAFDGAGHGADGAVWGGEFLVADRRRARRLAHLRYVRLPGGDAAAREPWRMALAYLDDAGQPIAACSAPPGRELERDRLARALRRGVGSPWTSSAGRLFDAVAALCGLRSVAQFEGQAACELEAVAGEAGEHETPYPFDVTGREPAEVDLRPTVRAITRGLREGRSVREVGARFHATLAAAVGQVAASIARAESVTTVVLSGGCFQNARLAALCAARLAEEGLRVLRPARFPPNDGGISLGQAAIALAQMEN